MLIVVSRVDEGVVGKGENLAVDRAVKDVRAAILEVRATAPVDEQGVARKDPCLTALLEQLAMMCVGVPWCEERP